MATSKKANGFLEFGPFRIDTIERLLLRDDQPVPLTPKAFDTLLLLVENSGHVLEKDELMKAIWSDAFVEEVNLAHNISVLRKALRNGGEGEEYIETVPRRGYRFIGRVRRLPSASLDFEHEERTSAKLAVVREEETGGPPRPLAGPLDRALVEARVMRRWLATVVFAIAFGLVGVVVYWWAVNRPQPQQQGPPIRSIAVLPFKPLVAASRDEVLELGLADTLITRLSNIKEITVRPTAAVRRYTDPEQDPLLAGQELKVDAVVDGSIQRLDHQLRITVRVVRVSDGSTLWAQKFDESLSRIFAVEDAVSESVAGALALTPNGEEKGLLTRHHATSTEAYQHYLKGRYYWNQRTETGLKKSTEYFKQAVAVDPSYAEAYSGIADACTTLGYFSYSAPRDCFPEAKRAATKALELEPHLAEPRTSLAYISFYYDWDWSNAEREFQQAIALNPNYPTAHHWYSVYLTAMQRHDEASAEINRAQQLDPSSLAINTDVGFELYYSRQYEKAIKQLETAIEMNRDFPLAHLWLGRTYQQKLLYEAALEEYRRSQNGLPNWVVTIAAIGNVYGLSGKTAEARKVLDQLKELSKDQYVTPYGVALVHAGLGDKDQTFAWLNKAYEDRSHWLVWLKLDPRWDGVRSDPRFSELLRRIAPTSH